MIQIRIKLKTENLKELSGCISQAIQENFYEIDYLDYYNLQYLIKKLLDKYHSLTTFDPFKPQRAVNLKLNINEAHSYRKLLLMESIIWENDYLSELNREIISQIDRQIENVKKLI
jgi:hypothetical protein